MTHPKMKMTILTLTTLTTLFSIFADSIEKIYPKKQVE